MSKLDNAIESDVRGKWFILKLNLNATNLSGILISLIGATLSQWQIVGIGSLLILGRKGVELADKWITRH